MRPSKSAPPILVPALLWAALLWAASACAAPDPPPGPTPESKPSPTPAAPRAEPQEPFAMARQHMVTQHLAARDIHSPHVLHAMSTVPREHFVPAERQSLAYADHPLPIGHRQTISQPYIVALMTQLAEAKPGMKALDVGTGSGYQAAVLSRIVDHVYGIEIVCPLADRAKATLAGLKYDNITVRCGDGFRGWPEQAPFDLIILAAAPTIIPPALIEQLRPGGRLVLPVGENIQRLKVVVRTADGHRVEDHGGVRFVPMTGEVRGDAPGTSPEPSPQPKK